MTENTDVYLKTIMELIARQTFSPADVANIVCPNTNSANSLKIYNLCNGQRTQANIVKLTGVSKGLLSRLIKKWQYEGVMLKVERDGKEYPLHIFPISEKLLPKG